jgi:hypothetical protein
MKNLYSRPWTSLLAAAWLTACVPQAFKETDYRTHLTREERQQLKTGRVVDKLHTSYWRFTPRQVYWQGPLRAEVDRPGHVRFTEHGTWYSYYRSGAFKDTTVYESDGKTVTWRYYRENGGLYMASTTVLTQRDGRPFSESLEIEFRSGNRLDTALIRRWGYFEKDGKTVLDERIEFDEMGHRKPVQKLK